MNQRMLIVTNAVFALLAVGAIVFAVLAMRQNAATNALLVQKLHDLTLTPSAPPPTQAVWAEATIPIVRDGQPADGFRVFISGRMFNESTGDRMQFTTDANGEVKIGPVRPGRYDLQISDADGLALATEVIFYPGAQRLEPIVWRTEPKQSAEVAIEIARPDPLPEALRDQLYYVLYHFTPRAEARKDVWTWQSLVVLADPQGRVAALGRDELARMWDEDGDGLRIAPDTLLFADRVVVDAAPAYQLTQAAVLLPSPDDPALLIEAWNWHLGTPQLQGAPAGVHEPWRAKVNEMVTWTVGLPGKPPQRPQ